MVKTPSLKKLSYAWVERKQLLKNKKFINKIKTFFSVAFFLLSILSYGYFVNTGSTKGYFIRVEKEKLSEIKFKNEIVKIDARKLESKLFDSINLNNYNSLTGKVITISNLSSVAMR